MNEILKEEIKKVTLLIKNNEYKSALENLKQLFRTYYTEGIVSYYIGEISLILNEEQIALSYFLEAEKKVISIRNYICIWV